MRHANKQLLVIGRKGLSSASALSTEQDGIARANYGIRNQNKVGSNKLSLKTKSTSQRTTVPDCGHETNLSQTGKFSIHPAVKSYIHIANTIVN